MIIKERIIEELLKLKGVTVGGSTTWARSFVGLGHIDRIRCKEGVVEAINYLSGKGYAVMGIDANADWRFVTLRREVGCDLEYIRVQYPRTESWINPELLIALSKFKEGVAE